MPRFDYHQPKTLDALLSLLDQYTGRCRLIGGGTDMIPRMRRGLVDVDHVISVNDVAELQIIERQGEMLRIGAVPRKVYFLGYANIKGRRSLGKSHFPQPRRKICFPAQPPRQYPPRSCQENIDRRFFNSRNLFNRPLFPRAARLGVALGNISLNAGL